MVMNIKRNEKDDLLSNEKYDEIIDLIEKDQNQNNENRLYLGIAYYKKNDFEKALAIFEQLYKSDMTNEITTYLIICYLKLNKKD